MAAPLTKTRKVTLNPSTSAEIKASIQCNRIVVKENATPTTDFLVAAPTDADTRIQFLTGTTFLQDGVFREGQSFGFFRTVSGTVDFSVLEQKNTEVA